MDQYLTVPADLALRAYVGAHAIRVTALHRLTSDERGEGVISPAIAVLIMAFLGAAMWIAFNKIFTSATTNTSNQVSKIGTGG